MKTLSNRLMSLSRRAKLLGGIAIAVVLLLAVALVIATQSDIELTTMSLFGASSGPAATENFTVDLNNIAPCSATYVSAGSTGRTLAQMYAPEFRFDQAADSFPMDPQTYWSDSSTNDKNTRVPNHGLGSISNSNWSSVASMPIYYMVYNCGSQTRIIYWVFYGYQQHCDCCSGDHNADWEHVVVIVPSSASNRILGATNPFPNPTAVLFYQHKGWYTKNWGHYETNGLHPIVYVGKRNHGSYHDGGGTGNCCYWEDWRNIGNSNRKWYTWTNADKIVELTATGGPAWMTFNGGWGKDDIFGPLFRCDNPCTVGNCTGEGNVKICGTNGCFKSD